MSRITPTVSSTNFSILPSNTIKIEKKGNTNNAKSKPLKKEDKAGYK